MIVASSPRIDWTALMFSFGGAKTETKTTALHLFPMRDHRQFGLVHPGVLKKEMRPLGQQSCGSQISQVDSYSSKHWNKFKQVEIETFHPKPHFYNFLRTVVAPFHPVPPYRSLWAEQGSLVGRQTWFGGSLSLWCPKSHDSGANKQLHSMVSVYRDTWGMTATI